MVTFGGLTGGEMMTAPELVVVIDTRDPGSYAAGHIPGAVSRTKSSPIASDD
jgi:rhodanese-related sulfurtransferase